MWHVQAITLVSITINQNMNLSHHHATKPCSRTFQNITHVCFDYATCFRYFPRFIYHFPRNSHSKYLKFRCYTTTTMSAIWAILSAPHIGSSSQFGSSIPTKRKKNQQSESKSVTHQCTCPLYNQPLKSFHRPVKTFHAASHAAYEIICAHYMHPASLLQPSCDCPPCEWARKKTKSMQCQMNPLVAIPR